MVTEDLVTAPRWFRWWRPSPSTSDLIDCAWSARADGTHRLVPDGAVDVLWFPTSGALSSIWVCGPDTRSWSIDLPAGTPIAGVRFRPGAASSVLRESMGRLRDRRVRLEDLVGAACERRLRDEIEHARDSRSRSEALERWVRFGRSDGGADPVSELAASIRRGACYRVDDLAHLTGTSSRHVHRRFTASVGYGPAFFARVARLQRFMQMAACRPGRSLAELSVDAGYADQAHLGRDCRDLADVTPAGLVTELDRTSAQLPRARVRPGSPSPSSMTSVGGPRAQVSFSSAVRSRSA